MGMYDEYGNLQDEALKYIKGEIGGIVRLLMKKRGDKMSMCEMKMYWMDLTNEIDSIMGSEMRVREERMRMSNSTIRNTNSKEERE